MFTQGGNASLILTLLLTGTKHYLLGILCELVQFQFQFQYQFISDEEKENEKYISQWINQSINQSINKSINQSINKSINQSINQSMSKIYKAHNSTQEVWSRRIFFYLYRLLSTLLLSYLLWCNVMWFSFYTLISVLLRLIFRE